MGYEEVVELFCEATGTVPAAVRGECRKKKLCNTRFMIWTYLHYSEGLSANKIARIFGRERVNVFRGMRIIRHNMKYDEGLRTVYNTVSEKIKGMAEATPPCDMEEN